MRATATVLFATLAAMPAAAQEEDSSIIELPPPCGGQNIQIARMPWPSAAILAEIHARILTRELGCTVNVVAGDLAATSSSMATTNQPAVAPELWLVRVAGIWNSAQAADKVRTGAPSYTGGAFEGWYVPHFVAEQWPELTSAAAIAQHLAVFGAENGRGRFISCPPSWACSVINRNLLKAHGYDERFDIVEPGNRFELDTLIAEAESRREPILFYYWQPNAVVAQLDLQPLDMGAYDTEAAQCLARRDCADPQPSAFAIEPVVAALAAWVLQDAPDLAAYFQRASTPFAVMNELLAWQSEQGADMETVAEHFVSAYPEVWQRWVDPN